MSDDPREHWDRVHRNRLPTEVSWYQETPQRSLRLIRDAGGRTDSPIIDVGGGASRLVDHLLRAGTTCGTTVRYSTS